MKNLTLAFGVTLFVATLASGAASIHSLSTQETAPATAEELPSARVVVDRYIEKAKLRSLLADHKSLTIQATFAMPAMNLEGEMTTYSAKPNKLRSLLSIPSVGEIQQGNLGEISWRIHPFLGTALLTGMERRQFQDEAQWDRELKPESSYASMTTLGREEFAGEACYAVEFVAKPAEGEDAEATKPLRTAKEFYSVESALLIGRQMTAASPMGDTKVTTIITDYRETNGALMAMKMTVKAPQGDYEISYSSIVFDNVGSSAFDLPKAIQTLVDAEAKKKADEAPAETGGESGQ